MNVNKDGNQNKLFAQEFIEVHGPHKLIGSMLSVMTPTEASILVETSASHYPSTVAQSVLRDALNRLRERSLTT